jgi:small nuclear ribonucleoprotein (snRNP)-like protein
MIDPHFFEAFREEEIILTLSAGKDIRGKLMTVGSQWLMMNTASSNKCYVRMDNIISIHCVKDKPEQERAFREF